MTRSSILWGSGLAGRAIRSPRIPSAGMRRLLGRCRCQSKSLRHQIGIGDHRTTYDAVEIQHKSLHNAAPFGIVISASHLVTGEDIHLVGFRAVLLVLDPVHVQAIHVMR